MNFLPEDDPRWQIWKACESPIEQLLCCGLFALLGCKAVLGPHCAPRRAELAALAGETPAAFVFGQHQIRRFRVDFLVVLVDPKKRITRHFVIECDGKDYHSSDEQIAKDEARDADIVDAGYKFVARYSGSALHGDMPSVLKDIGRWLAAFGVPMSTPEDCKPYTTALSLAMLSRSQDRVIRQERRREAERLWEEELREARLFQICATDGF